MTNIKYIFFNFVFSRGCYLIIFLLLQVEVGDVILEVNNTDVIKYNTKEGKFYYDFHRFIFLLIHLHRFAFSYYK